MDQQERQILDVPSASRPISRTPTWRPRACPVPRSSRCSNRSAARSPTTLSAKPTCPRSPTARAAIAQLLRKANDLLLQAGCKRDGGVLKLPNGKPLSIEFLDSSDFLQPVTTPFATEPAQARHRRAFARRRRRAVQSADRQFRFRHRAGPVQRNADAGRRAARSFTARRRPTSRARETSAAWPTPSVDALIETIARRNRAPSSTSPAALLDRVLRAGRYWVPM